MSSTEKQQHSFPAAPPSHSAGDHEMRDYYAAQDASQPTFNQEPYLTPYLGLRARLSQVWINRWTILLLLVLIRTLLAIASLDDNLGSARVKALSACTSVENVGSAMASMPHYMSQGVNQLSADGIEKAINGLMELLILSITGVEEIVVFVINMLTNTYVCLITFAVGGGLHVAIDVAEDVGDFVNSTLKGVSDELVSAVGGFDDAMNKFLSAVDDVGSFFAGHDLTPPTIDLNDSISKLQNLQLPSGYDQGLAKLNSSIPTFAEVKNFTDNAIRLPFEEVKKLLNESLPKYTMNSTLFPVPAKEQLSFCSDNQGIDDFFDDLVHIERLARKIFLIVLIIAAILVCVPMAYREIRRWRFMQERARLIRTESLDPMDAVYLASRPYTSTMGLKLSQCVSSRRRKALIRWTVAYATTVPALFVLSLALAGLLGCLCQWILLKAIEKEVPALTNEVGNFADKVLATLNNASTHWAVGTNDIINTTNFKINDDVFGWVNTTTSAVNNTLNVFVDGMVDALNATFGGTPLYDPILEVLNCLVLLKIEGIEKGLTWVSDNAYIDFPGIPVDTFTLGTMSKIAQGDTSSNTSILATGPASDAKDEISDAVTHVTNLIAKAIKQEAIISLCILLIWFIIFLVGFIRSGVLIFRGGEAGLHEPDQITPVAYEKNQLEGFYPSKASTDFTRAPSYEQATRNPNANGANLFNGQPYTLRPRPTPKLNVTDTSTPIAEKSYSPEEKVGSVAGQNVELSTHRPTHIRASSHGNFALTSPVEPMSNNHYHDLHDPFADHAR